MDLEQRKVYVVFMDMEKAYDRLDCEVTYVGCVEDISGWKTTKWSKVFGRLHYHKLLSKIKVHGIENEVWSYIRTCPK